MLNDGEDTEIGANGINLSGGQRWRVTFARALYSRAGILVLDDIFSAVDAHVGRFIFEQGLTGELGLGRTRILVTHHVALVKSRTKYVVELGDGTVENAGLVDELEEDGTLAQIVSHQESADEIREDEEEPTAVNSEDSSDSETVEQLKKVLSKQQQQQSPMKFVEDEKREQGRVKGAVYFAYLKASGGWPFWTLAISAFSVMQILMTGMFPPLWAISLVAMSLRVVSLLASSLPDISLLDISCGPSICGSSLRWMSLCCLALCLLSLSLYVNGSLQNSRSILVAQDLDWQ